jgi:hypothetical protein
MIVEVAAEYLLCLFPVAVPALENVPTDEGHELAGCVHTLALPSRRSRLVLTLAVISAPAAKRTNLSADVFSSV